MKCGSRGNGQQELLRLLIASAVLGGARLGLGSVLALALREVSDRRSVPGCQEIPWVTPSAQLRFLRLHKTVLTFILDRTEGENRKLGKNHLD